MECSIGMPGSYHAWRSPTPMLMLESIFVLMDNGLEIPMEVNAQGNDDLRSFNLTDEPRNCLFYIYVWTVDLLIPKKGLDFCFEFWTEHPQNISCVDFWAY
ncbi:hypothetical protein CsSME_00050472 [Camellia sinensis var. sinensis]